MVTLFVLRHAEAHASASSDSARQLTDKGRAQAEKVGGFMAAHSFRPGLMLHSPYLRTVQTAEIVARALDCTSVPERFLASGMRVSDALGHLRPFVRHAGPILIVGHEPDLGLLMGTLTGTEERPTLLEVKKASLWCLEVASMRPGGAVLRFGLPVRLMP